MASRSIAVPVARPSSALSVSSSVNPYRWSSSGRFCFRKQVWLSRKHKRPDGRRCGNRTQMLRKATLSRVRRICLRRSWCDIMKLQMETSSSAREARHRTALSLKLHATPIGVKPPASYLQCNGFELTSSYCRAALQMCEQIHHHDQLKRICGAQQLSRLNAGRLFLMFL